MWVVRWRIAGPNGFRNKRGFTSASRQVIGLNRKVVGRTARKVQLEMENVFCP